MLKERRLTDELVLLAHLLAGLSRLSKLYLQGTEGWPHHLPVAEVLEMTTKPSAKGPRVQVGIPSLSGSPLIRKNSSL